MLVGRSSMLRITLLVIVVVVIIFLVPRLFAGSRAATPGLWERRT